MQNAQCQMQTAQLTVVHSALCLVHLLAVLEYDGTDFQGFQTQTNGRTVQAELERALTEFLPQAKRRTSRVQVVGGGRTDAGVHAYGQAASFHLDWTRDLETFRRALNAKLPTDIFVRRVVEVPENFSARYSAISRVYAYHVWNHPERSVFHTRYAYWIPEPLDVTAMASAARHLVGKHDFRAFGSPPRGDNTVREVKRVQVERVGPEIIFTFEANAYLYRMVRRMVGTLLLVGRGAMSPTEITNVMQCKRRAGFAAPPQGLRLMEIKYAI
jgi:tRNA pseudouridine38-40 synthase